MNKMVAFSVGLMSVALGTCVLANNSQKNGDIELVTTDYSQNPAHVIVHTVKPITAAMLHGKGVKPIEIAVTNHGSKAVTLTHKSVQIRLADSHEVSCKFHAENQYTSSLLLDALLIAGLSNGLWMSFTGPMALFTVFSIGFFPGGLLGCLYWSKVSGQNKQMTADFMRDILALQQKPIIVHSGQTVRRFLLLDYASRVDAFTLCVYDSVGEAAVTRFSVYV
jgi:hypothetical protein